MLLIVLPENFTVAGLFVFGMLSLAASASTILLISYFRSRRPEDKNILNKQILINFYIKLLGYIMHYMTQCVGYVLQTQPENHLAVVLSTTLLSHSNVAILVKLAALSYTLMSASRMVLFISPSTFATLKTSLLQWISISIIITFFTLELILNLVVYSPDKCTINQFDRQLHYLASSPINSAQADIEGNSKMCSHFPTFRILVALLIVFEAVSVIAQGMRMSGVNKNRIHPAIHIKQSKKRDRSYSVPALNISTTHHQARRSSFPTQAFPRSKEPRSSNTDPSSQSSTARFNSDTIIKYLLLFVRGEYSVVLVIYIFFSINGMLPFYLRIDFKVFLIQLDLFAVPVFWLICNDKIMQFTENKIRRIYYQDFTENN